MSSNIVTCAVLIIGDEILSGRTQDTNLNAIAKYLAQYGIDVPEARVVGDKLDEMVAAINHLRTKYDYLITTGGIGPTHDDITADAIAAAFGVELYMHPEIVELLESRWGKAKVTDARLRMARVPKGGFLTKNPVAGPPGFGIENVFVLAGVPSIMRGMLLDVAPRMRPGAVTHARTLRVEGSGEGVIAAPLEQVAKAHPDMSLGSYPFFSNAGYGSNLVLRGRDVSEVEATVLELTEALRAAGIDNITPVENDQA